jgi:uncharacterized protein DUF1569
MRTLGRERDQAEVLRRLRALHQDSVGRWGRMSAHQMVCHLSDGYRLLTGERTTQLAPTPLPRLMMRWIALYAPMRWPAGIPTTPELDQDVGGTRPADFNADVAELEKLLRAVATQRGRFAGYPHPIFGRMSESAWLRWAYLHADHHLRQFGV